MKSKIKILDLHIFLESSDNYYIFIQYISLASALYTLNFTCAAFGGALLIPVCPN